MTSARPFFMWFLLVGMAKKGSFLLLFYLPWKQEKIKTYHGYREFRVIGHFLCFLMPMELVFIELHWHLFFLR